MTTIDLKSGNPEPWHRLQVALYAMGKELPEVEFVEAGHRYTYQGREIPSVTTILSTPGKYYAPGSAERGHQVHKMIMLHVQGILDETTLDPFWMGYLNAYKAFEKAMMDIRCLGLEQIVGDLKLGYVGRRDLCVEFSGGPPALILYLGKNGKFRAHPIRGADFNAAKVEAINRVVEYHEKARLAI